MEILEPRVVLMGNPLISEIQAVNASTLSDGNGEFSDWVEIRNPDAEAMDISGWYLTDDNVDLRQWRFPDGTVLNPGEHLVVFASGNNQPDGAGKLHTNFKLSGSGEYLALVKPDGITITQEFAPFPGQTEDQSYGLAVGRDIVELAVENAPVRAFVPTDDTLGSTWTDVGFDDSAWASGTGAVGYEILDQGFSETDEFDVLGPEWTVEIPNGGSSTVEALNGELQINVPSGQDTAFDDRGTAPFVQRSIPGDGPTDWEMVTRIRQGNDDDGIAGFGVVDVTTGRLAIQVEYSNQLNFRVFAGGSSQGSRVSIGRTDYWLRLERSGTNKTWTASFKLDQADAWTEIKTITDGVDGVPIVVEPVAALYARTPTSPINARFSHVEFTIPDEEPVYGPHTGLDVEGLMAGTNSSIYLRIPFDISGDPARFDELDITTRFDDGFRAYLNGVEITAQNVPVIGEFNSAASTSRGAVRGVIPIDQFNVGTHLGALRQGENVLAIHGMNVATADEDFFYEAKLVAAEILNESQQFFIQPSPGAPNLMPSAPTPVIVGQQGVFFGSQSIELELSNPAPALQIHYTLDGTEPTTASTMYTGPIVLTESARLQARTFDTSPAPSFETSNAASGTFFALAEELRDRDSNIPIVILDTLGRSVPGTGSTDLVGMNVIMFDVSKATGRATIGSNLVEYIGRGGARSRGSSTGGQAKHNLTFETWGPGGTDKDDDFNVNWLNMGRESDWIFHAPFNFDRALMRNQLAFDVSNQMNMWAPEYRNVEVYLNKRDGLVSESDFFGFYALHERVKQGADRIDIAGLDPTVTKAPGDPDLKPGEPNISGGYIWKIDRGDPGEPGFTGGSQAIQWVYPKSPGSRSAREELKATAEQQAWVVDYFNQFNSTLSDPDINDPEGYTKYIEPISWVDHHMHNVWMMNVDALRLSAYFHKDRDGRVAYGPVWDFDRSAESQDERDDDPYVWRSEKGDLGTDFFGNGTQRWWGNLFNDPGFWQLYVDRWQMWRRTILSDANVNATIDRLAAEIEESADRNFAASINSGVRPRASSLFNSGLLDRTWRGEVENMRQWLKERAAFMDSNFVFPPIFEVDGQELDPESKGRLVTPGTEVSLAPTPLQFFNDTTLISGNPGETTASYFVPTDNALGTDWAALGFDDSQWASGPTGIGNDSVDPDTGEITGDFAEVIRTQVDPRAVMDGAVTILTRYDFDLQDVAAAQAKELVLRMKYDDGFVVYVNGTEVLQHNLRNPDEELSWDSRANTRRSSRDSEIAETFEDFTISDARDLLVQGKNVLAIRAMNSSSTSGDVLVLPELVSREVLFGVNPNARVYYTTDGTDPRAPDGSVNPAATAVQEGQNVVITESTRVIARSFDDATDRGPESRIVETDWSGPIEFDFAVSSSPLVISEINYNPEAASAAEALAGYGNDDFEFVEIHNPSNTAASLIGIELTDGVEFDFYSASTTTIQPGGYAVVVRNAAAFQERYGQNDAVVGVYAGTLGNNGEDVDLVDATGSVIFSVNYGDNDPWPVRADGVGATLELIDPAGIPAEAQNKWYSWRASSEFGGSPGSAGIGPVGVVINEVLAHTEQPVNLTDSIELHNTTDQTINIGGWGLSDASLDFFKFQIPADTFLPAGGYLTFDESHFNPAVPPQDNTQFALSGDLGDDVWLVTDQRTFADDVHFRETLNGESLGRIPNGSGRLVPLTRNTFNADNGTPRVGPVVFSEIQYNPRVSSAALAQDPSLEVSDLEYIMVHNPTGTTVDLTQWRVRGGVDFDFVSGTQLGSGETIVLLKFNPDDPENINQLNAFKAHYGMDDNVRLLGGFAGQLSNSDDRVQLLRPDSPPDDRPNAIPRVIEDEVLYDDLAPWPTAADGTGRALVRTSPAAFGSFASSWIAGNLPDSLAGEQRGDFDGSGVVDATDINLLGEQLRSGNPDVSFDLTGDGLVDGADRDELVQNILGTNYGDSNLDGIFNSADLVSIFRAGEYEDGIPLNSVWETGDWSLDGDFASSDLVLAFRGGAYVAAAPPADGPDHRLVGAALAESPVGHPRTAADAGDGAVANRVLNQAAQVDIVEESIESLFRDDDAVTSDRDVADEAADALWEDGISL